MTPTDDVKDKQQAILDAALKLISENGFHGTPMSKIAKQAAVSAGIIYHYFDNKEALIADLYQTIKREYITHIAQGLDPNKPIPEQFRRIGQHTFTYCMAHPQKIAYLEQYGRSPYYNLADEVEMMAIYAPLQQFLDHAKREQIIKDLPEPVIFSFTMEAVSAIVQKHIVGMIQIDEALIEQVITASWDALRR